MQPAGLAEVQRAKDDGRWDAAYGGVADHEVPPELVAGLAAEPRAAAMFEILTSQNRFAILYRIGQAKRPETKARHVEKFVGMLARGETVRSEERRVGKACVRYV